MQLSRLCHLSLPGRGRAAGPGEGELREGVAQVYKDTSSRLISLKRAITSYTETKDLLGAIIAYFGNRSSGELWRKVSGAVDLEE